ncbi:MAG TPA: glycerol kinase GlpK, partial [Candidatus Baltobacteraceae bacterium]|nr:glycerol kinase GlpK [Candidatus Baltobacteraceae bacterium]
MKVLLALDQGTTSSRSVLFDLAGRPLASAQVALSQHFPAPGWVEHDPVEIWESQIRTGRDVLQATGTAPADIAGVGITNQRETTLIWERASGKPVHRAIVWQDRRTASLCDDLKARGLEKTFSEKTGLVLDPYFSGTKVAWLLRNVEGLAARAHAGELAFGTVDTWLTYNLSAGRAHLTDVTNASRTLLFNIHTLAWDDELLNLLEVPKVLLPEVRPSTGAFTSVDPALFGGSVPIAGIAGDQQAALFGQACFSAGMAKNTYGTGAFVVMNTGTRALSGPGVISTLAWQIEGQLPEYALEGSIFVAGAAVQWLRDGLGIIASSDEIEALAGSVPDTGGVYFVPALTGLG